jgi:hypothetical protein
MTRTIADRIGFARDESGAATVWMAFWAAAFLMLGGVAVDSASAWRARAALQAVADATAHAAAVRLQRDGEEAAVQEALTYAGELLPVDAYGEVLNRDDVQIGAWDADSGQLVASAAPDAVRVTLRRSDANGNPEPTYLLRLAGHFGWDIAASATARSADGGGGSGDPCWRQGLIARGIVNISSNNTFRNLCVHAEEYVDVQNQNEWLEDMTVSMPDLTQLRLPSSDMDEKNPGLAAALLEASNDPWVVDYVDEMIYAIRDANPAVWIDNALFDPADAQPGVVYWVYCVGDGGVMTVDKDTVLRDVAILTNCAIKFKKSVVLINTLMGTTGDRIEPGADGVEAVDSTTTVVVDDSTTTIYGANELHVGLDDDCAPGGGSRLLIDGDFHNPAKLRVYGSQIIATGDVEIAAGGDAVDGISVLAGGDIEITSNSTFGFCTEQDFTVPSTTTAVSMVE